MVSLETPICDFGAPAIDFALPGVDGKVWTLDQCRGDKGLLVMFICNHCPYVKSIRDRLVRDTRELLGYGINSVAIMANRARRLPRRMALFVLRTSLVTAPTWGFSTVDDWMPVARRLRPAMHTVTCLKPCCRWRGQAVGRRSRFPAWVAR
jgi:hypothetical protein